MSLFIRVNSNFYSHRKTLRLKAALGDEAFWIPPRMWAYSAEFHPDGNLSSYSAEELAAVIGYSGDAVSMLQALLKVGFLNEDMTIHDWEEYNGYHVKYAARARAAAEIRWTKERTKEREEIRGEEKRRDKHATSISTSTQLAEEIYKLYPKKVGKLHAVKAIEKALKLKPSDYLRERTLAFSGAVKGADMQFVPYPATWFNEGRYDDDPGTWKLIGRESPKYQNGHQPKAPGSENY